MEAAAPAPQAAQITPSELVPMSDLVNVAEFNPPHRLWRIPNTAPKICPGCNLKVERNPLQAVGHDWHPECFRCSLCRQPLSSNDCGRQGDFIFHHKCYLECFAERCAKCTELVDEPSGIQALGKTYHKDCFVCTKCGEKNLYQKKYKEIYGFPYCLTCFEEVTSTFPKCLTCKKVILPNHQSTTFFFQGKKYWTHTQDCFKCTYCANAITPSTCTVYNNRLICKACYDEAHKKICAMCNEPIFDQGSQMENVYWHSEHFICSVCRAPLKPNTCVLSFGVLKCRSCATDERPKCANCKKPITDNGISACGVFWHKECLKCQFCTKRIDKKSFPVVNSRPCCAECFEKLKSEGRIDKRGQLIDKNKRTEKHHHHKDEGKESHHHSHKEDENNSGSHGSHHGDAENEVHSHGSHHGDAVNEVHSHGSHHGDSASSHSSKRGDSGSKRSYATSRGNAPIEEAPAEPVMEKAHKSKRSYGSSRGKAAKKEEPQLDLGPVEEPIAEEPIAEEPIAEEPIAEEPIAEEEPPLEEAPIEEEPVEEAPKPKKKSSYATSKGKSPKKDNEGGEKKGTYETSRGKGSHKGSKAKDDGDGQYRSGRSSHKH